MCNRCAFLGGLGAAAISTALPARAASRTGDPAELEIAMPRMQRIDDTLWLGRLTPHVWIHTTTSFLSGVGYYPANGAIVSDGKTALLIDTGWDRGYARRILDAWAARDLPPVAKALVTHFHSDRTGGLDELRARGIPAYGNPLTIGLALDSGLLAPRPLHAVQKHAVTLESVEVFYPGEGHTIDNIVAWIPADRVLFGGCLVKATTAEDLGNVADANVGAYPATLNRVITRYNPRVVIPGHGTIAGDSLTHTLRLAESANRAAVSILW
jgi:metallo-beta-lactamase class B